MGIYFEDETFEHVIGDSFDSGAMGALEMLEKEMRWWWGPRKMRKEIERLRSAIIRSSLNKGVK